MSMPPLADFRHPTDADVLAVLFPAAGASRRQAAATAVHVRRCPACTARLAEFEQLLDELGAAHDGAFEAAFPARRLAALQDGILRGLERAGSGRPPRARILRFPDRQRRFARIVAARRSLARNPGLLGATAAAALLIALGLAHLPPAAPPPERAATAAAADSASDEAFMDAVDRALHGPQVPELSTLDSLTPQLRQAAIDLW